MKILKINTLEKKLEEEDQRNFHRLEAAGVPRNPKFKEVRYPTKESVTEGLRRRHEDGLGILLADINTTRAKLRT